MRKMMYVVRKQHKVASDRALFVSGLDALYLLRILAQRYRYHTGGMRLNAEFIGGGLARNALRPFRGR